MQNGVLRRIHVFLDKVVDLVHGISACTTGLFLAILFVQVFMRYVFKSPIYGLDELVVALMVWSMALGFAVVYWGNEHAIIEMFLRRSPGLVRRIVYNITNLIALSCAIVLIPGGVKLFRLQVKTIPLGGLFFPRAYYYALPIIAMGALLLATSAFRTAEYAITGDDSIMTSTPAEGGVNVD